MGGSSELEKVKESCNGEVEGSIRMEAWMALLEDHCVAFFFRLTGISPRYQPGNSNFVVIAPGDGKVSTAWVELERFEVDDDIFFFF